MYSDSGPPIFFTQREETSGGGLTLRGVLLAVLPQAHGDEDHEDEHHDAQHTAHHQVQHVAAPGGAGCGPHVASASQGAGRGAQVSARILRGSGNTSHWLR